MQVNYREVTKTQWLPHCWELLLPSVVSQAISITATACNSLAIQPVNQPRSQWSAWQYG